MAQGVVGASRAAWPITAAPSRICRLGCQQNATPSGYPTGSFGGEFKNHGKVYLVMRPRDQVHGSELFERFPAAGDQRNWVARLRLYEI